MNKIDDYLEDSDVSGFINYFKRIITNERFPHSFTIKDCKGKWGKKWQSFNKNNQVWSVNSIKDAYEKYYWPLSDTNSADYNSNKLELDKLAKYIKCENGESYSATNDEIYYFIQCLKSLSENNIMTLRTPNAALKALKSGCIQREIDGFIKSFYSDFSSAELNASQYEPTKFDHQFIGCIDILNWGGVLGNNISTEWLYKQYKNNRLDQSLANACDILTGDSDNDIANKFGKDGQFLMNSGMTKIYSLYCGNSIIYDGRVGAALCLLVRSYAKSKELKAIPELLSFRWGAERSTISSPEKKRNPSTEQYKFNPLQNDSSIHALMNLRANWIFEKVIEDGLWGIDNLQERLRALESALFMIGYDVSTK